MVALLFKILFLILLALLCDWSFMILPTRYLFFFFLINFDLALMSSRGAGEHKQGHLLDLSTLMPDLKRFPSCLLVSLFWVSVMHFET